MFRLPWVSREHHEAVCLERDRLVVALKTQIIALERRLEQPLAVTVKLPDDFAMVQPAFVRSKRPRRDVPAENSSSPINWEDVDENNLAQLSEIAAREMGGGKFNLYALMRKVNDIKAHIRMAKSQKKSRTVDAGVTGTIVPPTVHVAESAKEDEEPDLNVIPAHILERIEAASQGKQ